MTDITKDPEFIALLAEKQKIYDEVNKCNSLTYLQAVRVSQAEVDGFNTIKELLEGALTEEIQAHPDWIEGNKTWDECRYTAKMHFEDADALVTGEYAYRIYLAVKAILDKGDKLT